MKAGVSTTAALKAAAKRLAGPRIAHWHQLRLRRGERSWSQEGEDRVLWRYFEYRRDGFYVDVGAHHPFRFSNTCLLHRAGWRGINIDAMPGSMAAFDRYRPGDVNLEIGISRQAGTAKFHVFNEPALNTFDAATAAAHSRGDWAVERIVEVPLRPLADVLAENAGGRAIDLLTVDAEGHDLSVLELNDWRRFRPAVVLAESLGRTVADLAGDPCARFMAATGYEAFAKTVNTVMYVDGTTAPPR